MYIVILVDYVKQKQCVQSQTPKFPIIFGKDECSCTFLYNKGAFVKKCGNLGGMVKCVLFLFGIKKD